MLEEVESLEEAIFRWKLGCYGEVSCTMPRRNLRGQKHVLHPLAQQVWQAAATALFATMHKLVEAVMCFCATSLLWLCWHQSQESKCATYLIPSDAQVCADANLPTAVAHGYNFPPLPPPPPFAPPKPPTIQQPQLAELNDFQQFRVLEVGGDMGQGLYGQVTSMWVEALRARTEQPALWAAVKRPRRGGPFDLPTKRDALVADLKTATRLPSCGEIPRALGRAIYEKW